MMTTFRRIIEIDQSLDFDVLAQSYMIIQPKINLFWDLTQINK